MRLERAFFRSRVARRIFILFVCCALLPVAALALFSFSHVTKQLDQQSQRRRLQESKSLGMALLQRLLLLEAEMRMVAAGVAESFDPVFPRVALEFSDSLRERFKSQLIAAPGGKRTPLFGDVPDLPELDPGQRGHLLGERALLHVQYPRGHAPRILMGMALDPRHRDRGILWGEVDPKFLWTIVSEDNLPPMSAIVILDGSRRVLFSSQPVSPSSMGQLKAQVTDAVSGDFMWKHDGKTYLASYRTLFMKVSFHAPQWTVVMSEPQSYVMAPTARFKQTFPFIILFALLVVMLLSISQIRRNLIPLDRLREGTRRIGRKEFDSRVAVDSGDEFEELADSFNAMAGQLGRQFHMLTTVAELDRAILSALDTEKIIRTVLDRMRDVFPCDSVSVALLDPNGARTANAYVMDASSGRAKRVKGIKVNPEEVKRLNDHPESLYINEDQGRPHLFSQLGPKDVRSFLALPIFLKQRPAGLISLGRRDDGEYGSEDLAQARQLANQVAVALSNAGLLEELDRLNWGTLTALARTIDAKSHWTAGHSERMTQLALNIGRVLGLSKEELDNLHRGGLLHDIGKIGIPASILNKAGKLSDTEYRIVQQHPRIGARILEPIPAYADVIPMVLHHHERFDGKGYPDGLAGEAIHLGARIFAVADVYDSLTSGRPYRSAMPPAEVIETIQQWSGSLFDGRVVQAFMKVMLSRQRVEARVPARGGRASSAP